MNERFHFYEFNEKLLFFIFKVQYFRQGNMRPGLYFYNFLEWLLKTGVNVNFREKNNDNETPLHFALESGM